MSVVNTMTFNMPLGNPADIISAFDSRQKAKETALSIAAGYGPKGQKKYIKSKSKKSVVRTAAGKREVTDKPLNPAQMRDIASKKPTVTELGATIPIHPGRMPAPTLRGDMGKFTSNESYGRWKERARGFNAGLEDQVIVQGHGASSLTLPKITVPGKVARPRGYDLPRGTSDSARRTRRGRINRMQREAIKTNQMRNRNLNRRQNFPS